jgi:putative methyltransferase (TIGR04325 family)
MGHFLKTVGRELLLSTPVLRESYYDYEFARRRQSFRGVYGSFYEALEHVPAGRPAGYEHEDDTAGCAAMAEELNPADYPVLYWLARILPEARGVFDLGGNVGVAFYAYRKFLDFAPGLRWTVCEIASTVAAGRALAEKRGKSQLGFTEDRAEAAQADVFFTAGALQYIEEPLAEMLAGLARKPRHVVVQRVPLQEGERFVTLQNNGTWVVPYQVANEGEFIAGVTGLGYELVDQWPTWRSLQVAQRPFDRSAAYKGMYFRLRG